MAQKFHIDCIFQNDIIKIPNFMYLLSPFYHKSTIQRLLLMLYSQQRRGTKSIEGNGRLYCLSMAKSIKASMVNIGKRFPGKFFIQVYERKRTEYILHDNVQRKNHDSLVELFVWVGQFFLAIYMSGMNAYLE